MPKPWISDERAAVEEVFRVLRPGGSFSLLEHVRSPLRAVRAIQRLIEPLSIRFEADHLTREPLEPLSAVGFEVEEFERSEYQTLAGGPTSGGSLPRGPRADRARPGGDLRHYRQLADLIHNFGDAATAIPLGIAVLLRSERAERGAGLFVVFQDWHSG